METVFADLTGRQAVITGASSGIGRAMAWKLASAGADVLLHHARESSAGAVEHSANHIRAQGRRAEIIRLKFAADTPYAMFVEECLARYPQLDIWINNAGVDLLTGEPAKQPFPEKMRRLFDVDVHSTLQLTKLVGAEFKRRGKGVIINIGWDQADRGMEGDSGELFAAAKNAIMGATRSFAVSLAPEVRVLCIAPGWIRTAWGEKAGEVWQERVIRETPLARWGTPDDVAKVARFLVSDEASYLTGQVINVNGGAVR
jgi:3-oxoacyl-[acyl-carrier protein] reductase